MTFLSSETFSDIISSNSSFPLFLMSAFEMLPHIQEQYSMLVKNMDSAGSHMDLTLFQGIIVEENYINSIGFLTAKLLGSCDNK